MSLCLSPIFLLVCVFLALCSTYDEENERCICSDTSSGEFCQYTRNEEDSMRISYMDQTGVSNAFANIRELMKSQEGRSYLKLLNLSPDMIHILSTYFKEVRREDDDEYLPDYGTPKGVCFTEFWGAMIVEGDRNHELIVFGEDVYLDFNHETFQYVTAIDDKLFARIDTSLWEGKPIQLACSTSSIYVKTTENKLYFAGGNYFHETETDEVVSFFTKSAEEDVLQVHASYHTVYILKSETTVVSHLDSSNAVTSVEVYRLKSIGYNPHGSMANEFGAVHSEGRWYDIRYDYVADPSVVAFVNYEVDPGLFELVFPEISTFQFGFWLKYKLGEKYHHYYAGKLHPSELVDVDILKRVAFEDMEFSQLSDANEIDFVDRLNNGNMYFVVGKGVYVSGYETVEYGIPGSESGEPKLLQSPEQLGDFLGNDDIILEFSCQHACFIMTNKKLYMFGRSDFFGSITTCEDNNCQSIKLVSEEIEAFVLTPGVLAVEEKTYIEYHEVYFKTKIEKMNTLEDDHVYQYPPEIVFSESGLENDIFTLMIRKPIVFESLEPSISFEDTASPKMDPPAAPVQPVEHCLYPYDVDYFWRSWTDEEEGFDYYLLQLPWEDFRTQCAMGGPVSEKDYDSYETRVYFEENFYKGMFLGNQMVQREEFIFDLVVKFPKTILEATLVIKQDELDDWWTVYIVDKMFDRTTRIGEVIFNTLVRNPNYLVFENTDMTKRIPTVSPSVPEFFIMDEFTLMESDGVDSVRRTYTCDTKYCYQQFKMTFQIIDDYRVCYVPDTTIPIQWKNKCEDITHYDCLTEGENDFIFDLILSIDNLCGGELIQVIDVDFDLKAYSGWDYTEIIDLDSHEFLIGDWVYFIATLTSPEVTITETKLDQVVFTDGTVSMILIERNTASTNPFNLLTQYGEQSSFVVDDLGTKHQIGYHFKISNYLANLQPGITKQFIIETYLYVMYEGNDKPVISERRDQQIEMGMMTQTKSININILNKEEYVNKNLLQYIIVGAVGASGLIALLTCVLCGIVLLYCRNRSLKKRTA